MPISEMKPRRREGNEMKKGPTIDVVRAWKDPTYRKTLSASELKSLPPNPAGNKELLAEDLKMTVRSWVQLLGCDSGPYTDNVTYWSCHCDFHL